MAASGNQVTGSRHAPRPARIGVLLVLALHVQGYGVLQRPEPFEASADNLLTQRFRKLLAEHGLKCRRRVFPGSFGWKDLVQRNVASQDTQTIPASVAAPSLLSVNAPQECGQRLRFPSIDRVNVLVEEALMRERAHEGEVVGRIIRVDAIAALQADYAQQEDAPGAGQQ